MLQHVCDSLGVGENNVPTVIQIKRCRICLPDTRGEKLCCRKCLLPATVQEINLSSLVSFCSEGDALFFSSSFFPSACLGKKKKSVFARRYHTCHQFSKIIRQSNVPWYVSMEKSGSIRVPQLVTVQLNAPPVFYSVFGILCSVAGRQVLRRWEVIPSTVEIVCRKRCSRVLLLIGYIWRHAVPESIFVFNRWGIITVQPGHTRG